jgi:hypothetical protein
MQIKCEITYVTVLSSLALDVLQLIRSGSRVRVGMYANWQQGNADCHQHSHADATYFPSIIFGRLNGPATDQWMQTFNRTNGDQQKFLQRGFTNARWSLNHLQ